MTVCTICNHPRRHQLDIGLVHRTPHKVLAKRFGVSPDALYRHGRSHLPAQARAAILTALKPSAVDLEQLQRSESEGLLSQLVTQRARLQQHSEMALELGDVRSAVAVENAITGNLTLVAKLLGQLVQHHEVRSTSILISPDYLALRSAIVRALRPHPEAGRAVGQALAVLEQQAAQDITDQAKAPLVIEHQGDEFMMLADISRAIDPVRLAGDVGIACDDWQARALRLQAKRSIWLCSRQCGKSTTACLMALHEVLYAPPALVLMLSPSLRQSSELFRTFMAQYHELKGAPELHAESALRCEFKNGSRVISLPGSEKTVRGYAACNLVVIDEASRVSDDLLQAIKPTLATTDGRIVALTTPAGRSGWLYELWSNGDLAWDRVQVRASDCPRISKEFLAQELKDLGPGKFAQEYDLEFVDSESSAFMSELIERAFTDEVRPLW